MMIFEELASYISQDFVFLQHVDPFEGIHDVIIVFIGVSFKFLKGACLYSSSKRSSCGSL